MRLSQFLCFTALSVLLKINYVASQGSRNTSIRVAFSAGLTQNIDLDSGEVLIYDRVITNVGNSYSPFTGAFTCPAAGIYVFHITLKCQERTRALLMLKKNDQHIISLYERDQHLWASSGASVILQLQQNDIVLLQSSGDSHLYGETSNVYTLFSGSLLYPD